MQETKINFERIPAQFMLNDRTASEIKEPYVSVSGRIISYRKKMNMLLLNSSIVLRGEDIKNVGTETIKHGDSVRAMIDENNVIRIYKIEKIWDKTEDVYPSLKKRGLI